jgi:hypothetical protein
MKIVTKAALLAHPTAHAIPWSLWVSSIFEAKINTEELGMMTTDLSSIVRPPANGETWDDAHQLRCWLGVLLGHPAASPVDLLRAADTLTLPRSIVFKGAILANRLDIVDAIETTTSEIKRAIAADNYFIFRQASSLGYLDALRRLLLIVPEENLAMTTGINPGGFLSSASTAFANAAGSGHLAILDWFKTILSTTQLRTMIKAVNFAAFRWAAANGDIAILNWLENEAPDQLQAMIKSANFGAFCSAAENGHMDVLNWLKDKISPDQWPAMIAGKGYYEDGWGFGLAANGGHLDVLNWFETFAPEQLQERIAAGHYGAFRSAARGGHIAVLNWLKDKAPGQLRAMIAAVDYNAFGEAADGGHIDVLNWLKVEAPDELPAMLAANGNREFGKACGRGDLVVLEWLLAEAPEQFTPLMDNFFCFSAESGNLEHLNWIKSKVSSDQLAYMMESHSFAAIREAAEQGHVSVLDWLKAEATTLQLQTMIAADSFSAFRHAAARGKPQVLDWLKTEAPEQLQAMIDADSFYAFRNAAWGGHVDVLQWLKENAPDKLPAMIATNNCESMKDAIRQGHLEAFNWLITEAPDQLPTFLADDNFLIFKEAMRGRYWRYEESSLHLVNRLLDLCPPDKLQDMIASDNYASFDWAAENGQLDLLNRLITICAPEKLQNMFRGVNEEVEPSLTDMTLGLLHHLLPVLSSLRSPEANEEMRVTGSSDYRAFRSAASKGHLTIVDRVIELSTPDTLQAMIMSLDHGAFRFAAEHGHLAVVNRLIEVCSPSILKRMIERRGSGSALDAAEQRHAAVVNRLLSFPSVFVSLEYKSRAEDDYSKRYWSAVYPYLPIFINDQLAALHLQQSQASAHNPASIFNIEDAQEALLCFHFLKNLIRRNDPAVLNEIRFLLQIPAVKSLAHSAGIMGMENELLREAIRSGNQTAARLLLAIPAVREEAARHRYYQFEFEAEDASFDFTGLAQRRAQLQAYVNRIDGTGPRPDFSHGFTLFRQSRAINREANYLLAKSLLQKIDSGNEPLNTIFAQIDEQRQRLIVENRLNLRPGYVERGIRSDELAPLVRTGLR